MKKNSLFLFFLQMNVGIAFSQLPHAGIVTGGAQHICPGSCIDYLNASTNATSYQWIFQGASPSSSTDVDPQNICYNTPGIYDVTLIAYNSLGSDTLLLSNYMVVYPYPPPQGIQQIGDTLLANQGAVSYQWYLNGSVIPGATNYFYVGNVSGEYSVVAVDINGCEVETTSFGIIYLGSADGRSFINGQDALVVFPNPVEDKFTIQSQWLSGPQFTKETTVAIYNPMGEKIYTAPFPEDELTIDCRNFPSGIYYLEMSTPEKSFRTKFVKQ